ncbi:MAG: GNAT family N-acetyltransferase [Burkholderiales bacterium]
MSEVSIRRAAAADAEGISRFIIALSEEFIVGEFRPQGRAHFLADHSTAKVKERLAGDFRFYLAEDATGLAGVAAIRSNVHVYYLFVAKARQRTGLARRLWVRVLDDSLTLGNPGKFTVNASNYAVPAYESLGFRRTGSRAQKSGVLYNPMQLVVGRQQP